MNAKVGCLFGFLVVAVCLTSHGVSGDDGLLSKLQKTGEKAAKTLSNTCLLNDQCYKDFLTLDNYCCMKTLPQCCNVFDYIFSGE